jgi:hypothetical protein
LLASLQDASFFLAYPGCRYAQPRANGCDASSIGDRKHHVRCTMHPAQHLPQPSGTARLRTRLIAGGHSTPPLPQTKARPRTSSSHPVLQSPRPAAERRVRSLAIPGKFPAHHTTHRFRDPASTSPTTRSSKAPASLQNGEYGASRSQGNARLTTPPPRFRDPASTPAFSRSLDFLHLAAQPLWSACGLTPLCGRNAADE